MRIVHMDSGLGNQMLDYAEYLAIKEANPEGEYYIEKLIYELPYMPGMFSQWNGYELERIFGIRVPDAKELFTDGQWRRILDKVGKSSFWNEDWNFSPYITKAFSEEGRELANLIPDKLPVIKQPATLKSKSRKVLSAFFRTKPGYHIKRYMRSMLQKELIRKKNNSINIFRKYPDNVFIGHSLAFRYKGFGIEKIENKLREAFRFPEIKDKKNREILELIHSTNSVAIHARRSDMLFVNGDCYKFGFFKRAVKYIKRNVENPVFFFFCDEKSTGWCEKNEKIFGLDFSRDKVYFVDWNNGNDSFRDMQLMAECKHNIFTQSSFGFWGAYLNRNPQKITCAPDPLFLATNSF